MHHALASAHQVKLVDALLSWSFTFTPPGLNPLLRVSEKRFVRALNSDRAKKVDQGDNQKPL